ncbi:MAG: nucleotidyltransferase family protein [Cyanobium sp.]
MRAHQNDWRVRYQLQRIGLFGSTARNEATVSSDVDVWVELDPLTPFATVRLRERMNPALLQAILRSYLIGLGWDDTARRRLRVQEMP